MTSGNFDKEFQLIKDDITKEITKMREPVIFRLELVATIDFLSTGNSYKSYAYEYYFSYLAMKSSTFTSFGNFVFSTFSSLITSPFFLNFPQKLIEKQIT